MKPENMKFVVLLLSFLFFISGFAPASQNDKVKFERLSLDEGAALNLTYCMMQDHKGFMWFGTMYGLVKYDGKTFRVFKNNPDDENSISFDDIISLYEDSGHNIWIGTWGGGLNKFDASNGKFTRFISNEKDPDGISDNIIWTITGDKDNNLWFGTETGGLNKYISRKNKFIKYVHDENTPRSIAANSIRHLYTSSQGTIWICSPAGLSKYIKETDTFLNYKLFNETGERAPLITAVMEVKDGKLLTGTTKGLYTFNPVTGKFTKSEISQLNDVYVYSICRDKDNKLWIGSSRGLFNIDNDSKNVRLYENQAGNMSSISGNSVLNLLNDKSGILWINSYGGGISKLNPDESRFVSYSTQAGDEKSISNNSVTAFCIDENKNIWIGTADGLDKFNKESGTFETYKSGGAGTNRISFLLSDNNLIWVGTERGVSLFDGSTGKFKQLPSAINKNNALRYFPVPSLLKAPGGNLLIGTYGNGLFIYDPRSDSLIHLTSRQFGTDDIHMNYILTMYRDISDTGIVWIGTYGGLLRMIYNDRSFKYFKHILDRKESLSSDYVFSILRDSRGTLWLGTANGLNKFNESSGDFTHYFEKDGLPNSVISSIVEDRTGNLWLSTNYGLSEYDISRGEFINYNRQDGLANNLYLNHSSFIDSEGDIYFGGTNGVDIIKHSLFTKENFIPGVYITSIEKNNPYGGSRTKIIPEDKVNLRHNENFIDINFISLDYTNPLKNIYKYKLEGVDENWVDAGNENKASYTDLAPGSYIFRVKGSNSSGVFNPDEAILNINIMPPFWQTAWFRVIVVLLFTGLVYVFFRMRVRKKINHALEIEKIKEEESEKLRRKTAADFHDELGHRLTRISLLSEIIKRKIGNTSDEITDLLNKISSNSVELYEGTKDFIWAIDPNKDSLYELLIRLKDFGDELFGDSDILFEFNGIDESLKNKLLTIDWKRHLALIFKEGMNNSLKHGRISKISFNSKVNADNIELTLLDDGLGFLPGMAGKGSGLKNMKKRAEKLLAELEVKSAPGNGTSISFRGKIPGKAIHYN